MFDITTKLRTFSVIADRKSFTQAAQALGMANSSVSRQIGQLEEQFGAPLFIRTTRKVRLTTLGEQLYDRAASILGDLESLQDDLRKNSSEVCGVLKISVPWRYARMYIAPLLSEFLQRYPDIRLELTSNDSLVDLVEEGFDAAVRLGRLSDSSLIAKKLGDQHFVLAAAPSYLKLHPSIESHRDLEGLNILAFSYTGSNYTWKLKKDRITHRLSIKQSALLSNNADLLTQAALGGAGIVVQPLWAIRDEIGSGQLVQILEDYDVTSVSFRTGIYVLYSRENRTNPKVRAWVDFLSEKFE